MDRAIHPFSYRVANRIWDPFQGRWEGVPIGASRSYDWMTQSSTRSGLHSISERTIIPASPLILALQSVEWIASEYRLSQWICLSSNISWTVLFPWTEGAFTKRHQAPFSLCPPHRLHRRACMAYRHVDEPGSEEGPPQRSRPDSYSGA